MIAFPAAMLFAGVGAAVIGAVAVLTRGFYFIMVTLAFGQMLFSLFFDTKFAGGSDGAYIYIKPEVAIGGVVLLDLDDRNTFFYVCLALLVIVYRSAAFAGPRALRAGAARHPVERGSSHRAGIQHVCLQAVELRDRRRVCGTSPACSMRPSTAM